MGLNDSLLPEFDHEMANTRKTLERVPDDKFDWKPHVKSMAMGGLATHLSNLPTWAIYTINQDSLDLAPGGVPLPRVEPAKSRSELLELFDNNVANARAAIAAAGDDELFKIPTGRGRVLAYNFNPMHRALNHSDYRLLWNALLNWNALPGTPAR